MNIRITEIIDANNSIYPYYSYSWIILFIMAFYFFDKQKVNVCFSIYPVVLQYNFRFWIHF